MQLKIHLFFVVEATTRNMQDFASLIRADQIPKRSNADQDWNLHSFQKTWGQALAELQA